MAVFLAVFLIKVLNVCVMSPKCHRIWGKRAAAQVFLILKVPYFKVDTGNLRKTQLWFAKNSCLAIKSKRTREMGIYKRSSGREQKRRKIDRCQEEAGLGVTRKMGLIPPSIPAAFLLFEVTSGLNFPFWLEQKGSLLGGWKEARGCSCLPG